MKINENVNFAENSMNSLILVTQLKMDQNFWILKILENLLNKKNIGNFNFNENFIFLDLKKIYSINYYGNADFAESSINSLIY